MICFEIRTISSDNTKYVISLSLNHVNLYYHYITLEKSPRKRGIFILHSCEDAFVDVAWSACISLKQIPNLKYSVGPALSHYIISNRTIVIQLVV